MNAFSLIKSNNATDRLREGMPFIDHAGLGAYDNRARWLDAVGGSFWQPDPKAASYPGFSPYANRGCNPTRFLDPSGEEIVITHMNKTYKLWDSEGVLFTPGGDGVSEPVPEEVENILMGIQAAYTYGSAEMVGNMINSDRTFTYQVGAADGGTFTVPDGKGGSISTIAQGGKLSRETVIAAVVHETMHHAQFLHDQGGKTSANEVEANVFAYTTCINSMKDRNTPLFQIMIAPNEQFSNGVLHLSMHGYSNMEFINAAYGFFDSIRNNTNLYNHYKKTWHGLQLQSLLQKYRILQQKID